MTKNCSFKKSKKSFSPNGLNQQRDLLMVKPKVVIFMGTYNGTRYLVEQLDSIFLQTYQNWQILVSDDGSDDNTCQILKDYQNRLGGNLFTIYTGPRKGFAANFLSLVCKQKTEGVYYAYSDQDDIWGPNKLQRAIDWLSTISNDIPALYCTRTVLVNNDRKNIGYSPLFKKYPGFLNALVQNIGGGNTMVFNAKALNLLREAGENINIVAHDWWTYMLVSGAGGVVFYDSDPSLHYRQHGNNLIGSNLGWPARFRRVFMLFTGRFQKWNDLNFYALLSIKHLLTEENRLVLEKMLLARNDWLIPRLIKIKKIGIYRQTFLGNIGLFIAALIKKI